MTKSLFLKGQPSTLYNYLIKNVAWDSTELFKLLLNYFTNANVDNNCIKDLGITTQQVLHHEVDGNSNSLGIITKDLFVMKHRWLIMYSNL
jgi:hypothetical protein